MARPSHTILLADPDSRARAFLAKQLEPLECHVLEAGDGAAALTLLATGDAKLLITELYLPTGSDSCLITAVRRREAGRELRVIAHTHRSLSEDRDWALRAGADAYLIKPTRAQRVRYVVGRLITTRAVTATATASPLLRRNSLEDALSEIERGALTESSCIVFGRSWWQSLTAAERMAYRTRAKAVRVSLRSDSVIGSHYVEVRGRFRPGLGLSTERPESPYRR
jgi:CheY-like chemotaxis protein